MKRRLPFAAVTALLAAGCAAPTGPALPSISTDWGVFVGQEPVMWSNKSLAPSGPSASEVSIHLSVPPGFWQGHTGGLEVTVVPHSDEWSAPSPPPPYFSLTVQSLETDTFTKGRRLERALSAFLPEPGAGELRVRVQATHDTASYAGVWFSAVAQVEYSPIGTAPGSPLPDLVALAPADLRLEAADAPDPAGGLAESDAGFGATVSQWEPCALADGQRFRCLRLTTAIANRGAAPLEVRSALGGPGRAGMFRQHLVGVGNATEYPLVEPEYHAIHRHYHLPNFVRFELTHLEPRDAWGEAGAKAGFCLLDSTLDGMGRAGTEPPAYLHMGCEGPPPGTDDLVMGVTPGWQDVYAWYLADQWINVEGAPDGDYALEVVVDPDDLVRESDDFNNAATVRLRLSGDDVTLL